MRIVAHSHCTGVLSPPPSAIPDIYPPSYNQLASPALDSHPQYPSSVPTMTPAFCVPRPVQLPTAITSPSDSRCSPRPRHVYPHSPLQCPPLTFPCILSRVGNQFLPDTPIVTTFRSPWHMSTNSPSFPKRLAVLVSGGGRSLENICERIERCTLQRCQVTLVIASKNTAGAIQKAARFGIPTRVLRLKDFDKDTERFSEAISTLLDEFRVDLVVLAGWMHFYLIPPRFEGKVINIHPSLIPAFCGKGYYGHRVHQAVIDFGAKITGCTVHLADNKYDHGPIILQKAVPVLGSDSAEDLAARVFESETEALPEAIQLFVDEKLLIEGRHVRVLSEPVSNEV